MKINLNLRFQRYFSRAAFDPTSKLFLSAQLYFKSFCAYGFPLSTQAQKRIHNAQTDVKKYPPLNLYLATAKGMGL